MLKEQAWDPFVELGDNLGNTDLLDLKFSSKDWEVQVEEKNCQASRLVMNVNDECGSLEPVGENDGGR
jgi:hypothetical protein